jgi:hypothetical protein
MYIHVHTRYILHDFGTLWYIHVHTFECIIHKFIVWYILDHILYILSINWYTLTILVFCRALACLEWADASISTSHP